MTTIQFFQPSHRGKLWWRKRKNLVYDCHHPILGSLDRRTELIPAHKQQAVLQNSSPLVMYLNHLIRNKLAFKTLRKGAEKNKPIRMKNSPTDRNIPEKGQSNSSLMPSHFHDGIVFQTCHRCQTLLIQALRGAACSSINLKDFRTFVALFYFVVVWFSFSFTVSNTNHTLKSHIDQKRKERGRSRCALSSLRENEKEREERKGAFRLIRKTGIEY